MKPEEKRHTIVLLQLEAEESRTYNEYESVKEAIEGLFEIFEQNNETEAEYNVGDVVAYFEDFEEILFLVFEPEIANYKPFDGSWVKQKMQEMAPV